VQVPEADGLLIVMERAEMFVLDFLAKVPVTITQSPAATSLIVSVAVSEKVVVAVQLTAVWAEVLCTSMVVPLSEATVPLAPLPPRAGAAPATDDSPRTMVTESRAAPAAPTRRLFVPMPCEVLAMCVVVSFVRDIYSLRNASIGARLAARLAG
jgi:hypothetical protein